MNPVLSLFAPFLDQRDRWFLWFPALMAAGIGAYFALPGEPSPLWLLLPPLAGALVWSARDRGFLLPLSALGLALSLGFAAAQLETLWTAAPMLDAKIGPVSMTGRLMRAEALPDGFSRLTIKRPFIREIPPDDRLRYVRVKVRVPYADLPAPGERINLWGPLWPPSDPVAPHDYNFRRNAFFHQLGGSGVSYGELRVRESKYPPRFFWDGFHLLFEEARRALTLKVFDRLEGPEKAMTAALLSGSQSGIDKDAMTTMRASGLSHLLSISGVHVSMIGLLLYVPLRFLLAIVPWIALRLPIKKIAAGAAIAGTCLYTLLVGPETPTVRSALMTGLLLFAIIVDRKAMSLRLVALAAAIILLVEPNAAMGPSFQMSFAAVLGMVAAYEKRIDEALKEGLAFELPVWIRGFWRHGRDIILTSLIATAATTPFTLFHFQVFSFYGVIANMIAIPLTSFWVMPCLLLTYLTVPFGWDGPFIDGAGWGVKIIIDLAQQVAAWPWAQIYAPPMPIWAFALFIVGGLWLCLWHGWLRLWGLLPVLVACLYPLTVTLPSVFIAEEGTVWAVRLADGRLAAFGKKAENFTLHQWRQRTLNPETLYFTKKNLPELNDALSCANDACTYRVKEFKAVFLLKGATAETAQTACAEATAVIAPLPLPDCKAAIVIDAPALTKHGAHNITLTDKGPQITRVRERRGGRPWSVGWKQKDLTASPALAAERPKDILLTQAGEDPASPQPPNRLNDVP